MGKITFLETHIRSRVTKSPQNRSFTLKYILPNCRYLQNSQFLWHFCAASYTWSELCSPSAIRSDLVVERPSEETRDADFTQLKCKVP